MHGTKTPQRSHEAPPCPYLCLPGGAAVVPCTFPRGNLRYVKPRIVNSTGSADMLPRLGKGGAPADGKRAHHREGGRAGRADRGAAGAAGSERQSHNGGQAAGEFSLSVSCLAPPPPTHALTRDRSRGESTVPAASLPARYAVVLRRGGRFGYLMASVFGRACVTLSYPGQGGFP